MALRSLKSVVLALAVAAGTIQSAHAVLVRGSVRLDATDIHVTGGSIVAVGAASPAIDFSNTDVSALGAGNPWDQGSSMTNDCMPVGTTCTLVRTRIGGVMDIDTSSGHGVVAPRIGAESVLSFFLDGPGRLDMQLSLAGFTEVDPLSDFPGAGSATYSISPWLIQGPSDFVLGPSFVDASAIFGIDEPIGIDLPSGTYTLYAPAIAVKLCAESPAAGFCGAADVAAPPVLPLFGAALLFLGGWRARPRGAAG